MEPYSSHFKRTSAVFLSLSSSFVLFPPEAVGADKSPYRRRSSPCPSQRLARSQSALLPPASSPCVGTPVRLNPFSLRHDLNGGHIKLYDTPSKSLISLTFTLPPLPEPCSSPPLGGVSTLRTPPRRCQSLPCTPELGRPVNSFHEPETRSENEEEEEEAVKVTARSENAGQDSDSVLDLEMVSLERVEEEEEDEDEEEDKSSKPVDFISSGTAEGAVRSNEKPLLSGSFSSSSWTVPISNGPPSLPPLPRLNNLNGMLGVRQVSWARLNGYRATSQLPPPVEQDEVISCPSCCLAGFSFPSVCLRGAPALRQTPSLRPYRNLNRAEAAASNGMACRRARGLVPCEPGLPLPEAQT